MMDYKPSSLHFFWSFFFHSNRNNLTKMEPLPREAAEGIHDRGHFCSLGGYFTVTDDGLQSLKLLSRCKVSVHMTASHSKEPSGTMSCESPGQKYGRPITRRTERS